MNASYPLMLKPGLTEKILLLDGLPRAGKTMVGPLVSNLVDVDYGHMALWLDHIPILWRLGVLEDRSALAFLRLSGDYTIFDRMLGRFANDRPLDIWNIHRSLDYADEIRRRVTATPDGRDGSSHELVEAFNASPRYQGYVVHHHLPHFDLWVRAFPEVRFQSTVRHPVDLCDSWQRRNWGARWGTDVLAFPPAAETAYGPVPWFAVDEAEAYSNASPIDRVVMGVTNLMKMYDETYQSLSGENKAKIKFVPFEKFVVDPVGHLEDIASWLNTEMHPDMPAAIARERVPRKQDIELRRGRLDSFQRETSPEIFERLREASRRYEEQWGLSPVDV